MRYDAEEKELDLRMEDDDLGLERFAECLNYCEKACKWPVNRVVIRRVQKLALMADEGAKPAFSQIPTRSEFAALFGVPIYELEDGLTPRERSVQRALAELPPTRAEQIEQHLAAERKRQQAARDLKPDDWTNPPLTADDIPF